jgi:hypothetical protein
MKHINVKIEISNITTNCSDNIINLEKRISLALGY